MNVSDIDNIPKHIAIIMDGNGRWARARGLPRTAGHYAGINRVKEIIRAADELGIQAVTFFAFSTENWSRPRDEVSRLMKYLDNFLNRQIDELRRKNIRFVAIGRDDPVPQYLQDKLKSAEDKTRDNTGLTVVLALNYGARQEIVDAVKKAAKEAIKGKINIEDLDIEDFSRYLYTAGLPDPDFLIRTSGEMRISNFLLWQLSYAELYFTKKYWPDFRKDDLTEAVKIFQKRQRRFGNI